MRPEKAREERQAGSGQCPRGQDPAGRELRIPRGRTHQPGPARGPRRLHGSPRAAPVSRATPAWAASRCAGPRGALQPPPCAPAALAVRSLAALLPAAAGAGSELCRGRGTGIDCSQPPNRCLPPSKRRYLGALERCGETGAREELQARSRDFGSPRWSDSGAALRPDSQVQLQDTLPSVPRTHTQTPKHKAVPAHSCPASNHRSWATLELSLRGAYSVGFRVNVEGPGQNRTRSCRSPQGPACYSWCAKEPMGYSFRARMLVESKPATMLDRHPNHFMPHLGEEQPLPAATCCWELILLLRPSL